ncbi:MAG TPA: DUF6084 family protein [Bryobacteraceae bacterium]|nr:DUF6084 family protein [Bryobacteraceae bacterium]
MPDLSFSVESAVAARHAMTPLLSFAVSIKNSIASEAIYSVALRAQIQIEVARRNYSPDDQEHLRDLFGTPERWGTTLRSMLWTNAGTTVGPFTGLTSVELQVPCTFDFNVASTKYFQGLGSGDIPLLFLFSGTVFYDRGDGIPQVAPISWSKEARFWLPLSTWREMMDIYYPNMAWLCLRRDIFERLYQYKVRHGIPTWEAAIEQILAAREENVAA